MNPFSKIKRYLGLSKTRKLGAGEAANASPHPKVKLAANVDLVIGKHCGFNGMLIQNDGAAKRTPRATVRIGNHFHSGRGCCIRTSDHDFTRGYPMVHGEMAGYKSADVIIGDYVWLGNDVLIMKGVTIGDGVVIQARSVVVSDIPALAIAGGHPCRVFASRDREEFEFLKNLDFTPVKSAGAAEKRAFFDKCFSEFKASRSRLPSAPDGLE